ncbi:endocuticle structural glycoprotein SgAbd-2-like [Palaemon carinicauda]|uniref:endocuticle structural glycoprotein SgAbd-2-like n=1 Tax=Palaemon carinicauda TaxID=392227 RepID=UPI0035B69612
MWSPHVVTTSGSKKGSIKASTLVIKSFMGKISTSVMIVFTLLFGAALAAPQYNYGAPSESSEEVSERVVVLRDDSGEHVAILRDDRVMEEDGRFNTEFEAENGIHFAKAGSPEAKNGAIIQAGQYSYTAPDGTEVLVKFVANENGYQPQSDLLPVAPEFPHPIPQFVLDQIAFAAEEDARRTRQDSREAPSASYGAPQ